MKILHTADTHLKSVNDPQWHALEEIVAICNREHVDILVIAGDFFDSGFKGDLLRQPIRDQMSQLAIPTVLIPGNHDEKTFETSGIYLGDHVTIIKDLLKPVEFDGVSIWGLPYSNMNSSDVLRELNRLKPHLTKDKTNILLHHGDFSNAGNQSVVYQDNARMKNYMPVKRGFFKDFPVKYILSGHIHAKFDIFPMNDGQFFVYPGSPCPMDYTETGPRHVNLFEVGKDPSPYRLSGMFYEIKKISLDPLNPQPPIDFIKNAFTKVAANSTLVLTVDGYINQSVHHVDEQGLKAQLDALLSAQHLQFVPPEAKMPNSYYNVQDITPILQSPLFQRCMDKLNQKCVDPSLKSELTRQLILGLQGVI